MEIGLEWCSGGSSGSGQGQNHEPDADGNPERWQPEDYKSLPLGDNACMADRGLEWESAVQSFLSMYVTQDGTNIPSSGHLSMKHNYKLP